MPWMGVGVYLPPDARSCVRAGFSAFADFVDFFGALLRAGFFAVARFFMPRTLQPVPASVNAPAGATACR
jgi:hypothetical protein